MRARYGNLPFLCILQVAIFSKQRASIIPHSSGLSKLSMVLTAIVIMIIVASQNILITSAGAETGKGTDIFRVIMTVFGVENTKGDVIAIVTVNTGESSKVKFIDTETFKPVSSNLTSLTLTPNPNSNAGIMEDVATFPNVTVSTGSEYQACVMTTKDFSCFKTNPAMSHLYNLCS